MANFGAGDLRVVQPYDVAFREARSAVGAAPLLQTAREFASVAEAVADCELVVGTTSLGHRELQQQLHRLEHGAAIVGATAGRVALLFGSEKFGLSNEDLAHCHWLIRIATASCDLSMNLGQAAAVCLYELTRSSAAAPPFLPPQRAGADLEEQVTRLLLEALERSGYTKPLTAGSTEDKVRRLVRRLDLGEHDAPLLLGMLRQILWKIQQP